MKIKIKYLLIIYVMILLVIALTSNLASSIEINNELDINQVYHFSAYFILGILAALTFKKSPKKTVQNRFILLTILFALIIASIDELLQFFTPGRIPDFLDIAYDFFGVLSSQLFFYKTNAAGAKTCKGVIFKQKP